MDRVPRNEANPRFASKGGLIVETCVQDGIRVYPCLETAEIQALLMLRMVDR